MRLIVGLGNPGPEYAGHRHNIGFMAVDAIAARWNASPFRQKFSGQLAEANIGGEKVLLLKPQTYMNRSGDSVAQAMRFYKLDPADIDVIHDELDLVPGKVRSKTGGSDGGHNGLKSIDAHLGRDYRRIRLGIGHPGHKARVNAHVLSNFHKSDGEWLAPLLDALGRNADLLVAGDSAGLMNKLALAVPTAKSPSDAAPKEKPAKRPEPAKDPEPAKGPKPPKGQSHIRQARQPDKPRLAASGPMADMLRKLFGNKG